MKLILSLIDSESVLTFVDSSMKIDADGVSRESCNADVIFDEIVSYDSFRASSIMISVELSANAN